MADFAVYWSEYKKDCRNEALGPLRPLSDWRTKHRQLTGHVKRGDRHWFIASGKKCKGGSADAGYLVNVFRVREVVRNVGDDPNYPPEQFSHTIQSEALGSRWVTPPLNADCLVRPPDGKAGAHIGNSLQGPRLLTDIQVRQLETLLESAGIDPSEF